MAEKIWVLLATAALALGGCSGSATDKGTEPADDSDGYGADVDCDNANPDIHPDADEVCDGVDNNCDGTIDEESAVDATIWYTDADADGFGDPDSTSVACEVPGGCVADATDCDDAEAEVNPDAEEICDTVDNDCNGDVDEDSAVDAPTWYADNDGDGFGNGARDKVACVRPEAYVSDKTDCDDSAAGVYPGAWDYCNGQDDDCDGDIDEAAMEGVSFVTVDNASRAVYEVDPTTAAMTKVADLTGAPEFTISSVVTNFAGDGFVEDAEQNRMFSLDACSGSLARVGFTGVGTMCGISYGADGAIYGVDGVNNQLVQIDPTTGAATVVGPLTASGATIDIRSCGLGYDCKAGRLVMLEQKTKTFYEINTGTGEATSLLTTDQSFPYAAISYDPTDGTWLASSGTKLFRYDLSAGTYTTVGTFPEEFKVSTLDLHPSCTP